MKKHQNRFCSFFIASLSSGTVSVTILPQENTVDINGYYITYPDMLMLRLYLTQKFAFYDLRLQ